MSNSTEIIISIAEIGDAKIKFNPSNGNFLFNGKNPAEIPSNLYELLYNKFEGFLLVEVKEGINLEGLETFVNKTKETILRLISASDAHRVDFLFSKNDKLLSEEAENTHEKIKLIISTQKAVLNRVLLKLYDIIDSVENDTVGENILNRESIDIDISNINFNDSKKAVFNMSKKESVMLLYILEKSNLLQFESDNERRKFIENNFNFIEQRKNKDFGKAQPMMGVGSEISKFNSFDRYEVISNNRTLTILKKKLENIISEYKFSDKKPK